MPIQHYPTRVEALAAAARDAMATATSEGTTPEGRAYMRAAAALIERVAREAIAKADAAIGAEVAVHVNGLNPRTIGFYAIDAIKSDDNTTPDRRRCNPGRHSQRPRRARRRLRRLRKHPLRRSRRWRTRRHIPRIRKRRDPMGNRSHPAHTIPLPSRTRPRATTHQRGTIPTLYCPSRRNGNRQAD